MASMFEAVAPSRPDDLAVAAQLNLGFRLYFAAVVWGRPQAAPITRARYGASRRPLTVIIYYCSARRFSPGGRKAVEHRETLSFRFRFSKPQKPGGGRP